VRRAFWCPFARREVEVEFARGSWFGGPSDVRRCPVFEPSEAVICGRRCVEASYRRQWDFALPVLKRP
jgi:hypothetical protein